MERRSHASLLFLGGEQVSHPVVLRMNEWQYCVELVKNRLSDPALPTFSPSDNTSDRRLLSWVWEAVTSHFDVMDRNCKSQVHQLIVSHKMEKAEIPASISQVDSPSHFALFRHAFDLSYDSKGVNA